MNAPERQIAEFAAPIAFVANSLLAPMTERTAAGLDPAFWDRFLRFGDEDIARSICRCKSFAEHAGDDALSCCKVEYAQLFIGPPRPAAPPWETAYTSDAGHVGFGQATFEMRELLRQANLKLEGPHAQYEDHMGVELLLLAHHCQADDPDLRAIAEYAEAHPLSWAGNFAERVRETAPDGYYAGVAELGSLLVSSLARLCA